MLIATLSVALPRRTDDVNVVCGQDIQLRLRVRGQVHQPVALLREDLLERPRILVYLRTLATPSCHHNHWRQATGTLARCAQCSMARTEPPSRSSIITFAGIAMALRPHGCHEPLSAGRHMSGSAPPSSQTLIAAFRPPPRCCPASIAPAQAASLMVLERQFGAIIALRRARYAYKSANTTCGSLRRSKWQKVVVHKQVVRGRAAPHREAGQV